MTECRSPVLQDLLQRLDPHSYYISAEELLAAQEPLEGSFDGIGVEFQSALEILFRGLQHREGGVPRLLDVGIQILGEHRHPVTRRTDGRRGSGRGHR